MTFDYVLSYVIFTEANLRAQIAIPLRLSMKDIDVLFQTFTHSELSATDTTSVGIDAALAFITLSCKIIDCCAVPGFPLRTMRKFRSFDCFSDS